MIRYLPLTALLALAVATAVNLPARAVVQQPAATPTAAEPPCTGAPAPLPRELAQWNTRTPLNAGRAARNAPVLAIGHAADLRLAPVAQVQPRIAPGRPAAPDSYAGLVMFQVTRAGTYRVALGQKAWIDMVRGRAAIASSAHDMPPRCSGVAKQVDFPLAPGRYVLQLTGAGTPTLPAAIVRVK